MALKNYLTEGTYSIVDNVQIVKSNRHLRFNLKIFSDESMKVELAQKEFEVSSHMSYRAVLDTRSLPPENPEAGAMYLIGENPQGDWEKYRGLFAIWELSTPHDNIPHWTCWGFGPGEIVYDVKTDSYFTQNHDTLEKTIMYPHDDFRIWDKWFSSDKIFSSTSNLHKQIYLYLKSLRGFEGASSC